MGRRMLQHSILEYKRLSVYNLSIDQLILHTVRIDVDGFTASARQALQPRPRALNPTLGRSSHWLEGPGEST